MADPKLTQLVKMEPIDDEDRASVRTSSTYSGGGGVHVKEQMCSREDLLASSSESGELHTSSASSATLLTRCVEGTADAVKTSKRTKKSSTYQPRRRKSVKPREYMVEGKAIRAACAKFFAFTTFVEDTLVGNDNPIKRRSRKGRRRTINANMTEHPFLCHICYKPSSWRCNHSRHMKSRRGCYNKLFLLEGRVRLMIRQAAENELPRHYDPLTNVELGVDETPSTRRPFFTLDADVERTTAAYLPIRPKPQSSMGIYGLAIRENMRQQLYYRLSTLLDAINFAQSCEIYASGVTWVAHMMTRVMTNSDLASLLARVDDDCESLSRPPDRPRSPTPVPDRFYRKLVLIGERDAPPPKPIRRYVKPTTAPRRRNDRKRSRKKTVPKMEALTPVAPTAYDGVDGFIDVVGTDDAPKSKKRARSQRRAPPPVFGRPMQLSMQVRRCTVCRQFGKIDKEQWLPTPTTKGMVISWIHAKCSPTEMTPQMLAAVPMASLSEETAFYTRRAQSRMPPAKRRRPPTSRSRRKPPQPSAASSTEEEEDTLVSYTILSSVHYEATTQNGGNDLRFVVKKKTAPQPTVSETFLVVD